MITTADLLAPYGPVEYVFFPGESSLVAEDPLNRTKLEVRLQVYLDQAYTEKVGGWEDPDAGARPWALYRTFDAALLLMSSRPASENMQVEVLGSQAFVKDQRDDFRQRRQQYLTEYENAASREVAVTQQREPQTRTVQINYEY